MWCAWGAEWKRLRHHRILQKFDLPAHSSRSAFVYARPASPAPRGSSQLKSFHVVAYTHDDDRELSSQAQAWHAPYRTHAPQRRKIPKADPRAHARAPSHVTRFYHFRLRHLAFPSSHAKTLCTTLRDAASAARTHPHEATALILREAQTQWSPRLVYKLIDEARLHHRASGAAVDA